MRTATDKNSAEITLPYGAAFWASGLLLAILAGGCEKTNIVVIRDEARFQSDVLESDRPVLVDFYKVGCESCKSLEPILQKLATEYDGRAVILKFEIMTADHVATAPEIKKKYDIAFFPTVILFDKGREVHRWILDYDTDRYREKLDEYAVPVSEKNDKKK